MISTLGESAPLKGLAIISFKTLWIDLFLPVVHAWAHYSFLFKAEKRKEMSGVSFWAIVCEAPTNPIASQALASKIGETHHHDGQRVQTARKENPRFTFAAHPLGICDPRFKREAAPRRK
ncbi:MAG: hypothetical protein OXC62_15945 [Aestuariivita sp.]|nr:hypothetical protein [Aestuariivita sp.]